MRMPTGRRRSSGGGMMKGRLGIIVVGLIGMAIYWMSNQQVNPYSGKKEFNTISIEQAQKLGAESYQQILQQEMQQGNDVFCASRNDCTGGERELTETVREIGARLEQAAIELERDLLAEGYDFEPVAEKFDWQYYVVENNTPNAFCLPGGYVAVYTGILDVTGNSDGRVTLDDIADVDKLAVVMGHEIGHALAHHGAKRMSQQKAIQMGQMAVGVGLGDMGGAQQQAVMQAFGMAAKGRLMAFSREHETQADEIGLELLVRACYDPTEAPELWERMGALSGGKSPPEWMSTHPSSEARAANFRRLMPEYKARYEANCRGRGF